MTGKATHLLKRIPLIKFPQRHPSVLQKQASSANESYSLNSEVPAAPENIAFGGKASLQPKRTPVSDHEIEAILSGGCY
ncbi:unknownprotein [Zostera marina]|uniref:Uncharacterized protein n=1 Tax=Zostera marina TaxID=29655 RepID=A0A0K9PVN1_ZOSMR|nr:unknownprotein [Zostera marina]